MFDANPDTNCLPDPVAADAEVGHAIPGYVDRREKRVSVSIVSTIRLPDGTEFPCIVKDISQSGAKLGVPVAHILPERFMFKMTNRDLVFQVRLAWRRETYAGVTIERIAKLTTAVATTEAASISDRVEPRDKAGTGPNGEAEQWGGRTDGMPRRSRWSTIP